MGGLSCLFISIMIHGYELDEVKKVTKVSRRPGKMTDEEILRMLEDTTMEASRHQLETLQSILERQAGVLYLRPHLHGHDEQPVDDATFRRAVPLSSYDDYVDHIDRMADGLVDHDLPLLSVDTLLCFFLR